MCMPSAPRMAPPPPIETPPPLPPPPPPEATAATMQRAQPTVTTATQKTRKNPLVIDRNPDPSSPEVSGLNIVV